MQLSVRSITLLASTVCTISFSQTISMKNFCATANGATIFFQTSTGAIMLKSRIADRRSNIFTLLFCVAFTALTLAQESPTPTDSPSPGESPSPSNPPEQLGAPSPTPEQTPSPSPVRSVRISFVPPPMEGMISLGIYDQAGKLVRVLHQDAQLNDFTVGADALVTRWDGKDDGHQDLPPGRYRGRGYLIGALKREDLGETSAPSMESETNVVKVRLV